VTVCLQQVLLAGLDLLPMTAQNKPGGASQRIVAKQQAKKLKEEDHLCLQDEIGRRVIADHYEEENDIGEESDDELLEEEEEAGDSDSDSDSTN
jgi:hypothetical protein